MRWSCEIARGAVSSQPISLQPSDKMEVPMADQPGSPDTYDKAAGALIAGILVLFLITVLSVA